LIMVFFYEKKWVKYLKLIQRELEWGKSELCWKYPENNKAF